MEMQSSKSYHFYLMKKQDNMTLKFWMSMAYQSCLLTLLQMQPFSTNSCFPQNALVKE